MKPIRMASVLLLSLCLALPLHAGVVNLKSTGITNADATPRVPNDSWFDTGALVQSLEFVTTTASDTNTSTYRFMRVRSSDLISSAAICNAANTSGTDYDLGIYNTAANGGAVVDVKLLAKAIDLSSARATWTQFLPHSPSATLQRDGIKKRIWELLALTKDPNKEYDITLTANTAGSAGGVVSLKIDFVR